MPLQASGIGSSPNATSAIAPATAHIASGKRHGRRITPAVAIPTIAQLATCVRLKRPPSRALARRALEGGGAAHHQECGFLYSRSQACSNFGNPRQNRERALGFALERCDIG